jgi:hypothetical protein
LAIQVGDGFRGGSRRELSDRAPPGGGPECANACGVAGQLDDRTRHGAHVLARHDDSRLAVSDDLRQSSDIRHDRCTATLRRLERDHPEALAA